MAVALLVRWCHRCCLPPAGRSGFIKGYAAADWLPVCVSYLHACGDYSGLAAAARRGALIKGGAALDSWVVLLRWRLIKPVR